MAGKSLNEMGRSWLVALQTFNAMEVPATAMSDLATLATLAVLKLIWT